MQRTALLAGRGIGESEQGQDDQVCEPRIVHSNHCGTQSCALSAPLRARTTHHAALPNRSRNPSQPRWMPPPLGATARAPWPNFSGPQACSVPQSRPGCCFPFVLTAALPTNTPRRPSGQPSPFGGRVDTRLAGDVGCGWPVCLFLPAAPRRHRASARRRRQPQPLMRGTLSHRSVWHPKSQGRVAP